MKQKLHQQYSVTNVHMTTVYFTAQKPMFDISEIRKWRQQNFYLWIFTIISIFTVENKVC